MRRVAAPVPAVLVAGIVLAVALIAACGGGGDGDPDDWSPQAIAESQKDSEVAVTRFGAVPGIGPTRLTFALIDSDNALVHDAEATVRLYRLSDGDDGAASRSGTFVTEAELRRATIREETDHEHDDGSTHAHDDPLGTIYYANVELDAAGDWGAEVDVAAGGEEYEGLRTAFIVLDDTTEPSVGDPIPASEQLTLADTSDISSLTTAEPPNPEMHGQTVAEALQNGRPLVIAFATPLFCQTRFCGPLVDAVVRPLQEQFDDEVDFIHIEPFYLDEERRGQFVAIPEMEEWGLRSEPWLMIVGPDGRLAAKFEGITDLAEVTPVLERVIAGELPYTVVSGS